MQQRRHRRRLLAAVRTGGAPNPDLRHHAKPVIQDLLHRLLGPHRADRIDDVPSRSRHEARAQQQAQQQPQADQTEDRSG
ncbi:MAG: hypothetical protein OXF96_05865 [Chloroflexi bacterium]|nr:hypothetical protein [Chloroflexota bacterium]